MKRPTLLEQMEGYCGTDALPMHMPGHKRNKALAPYLNTLGAGLDLTEIHGFSDLHDPEGALAERMEQAAALWGSRRAWWLIGGSTAGLLAGIFSAVRPGNKVLLARNCHRSVYHGAMLRRVETRFLQSGLWPGQSFCGPVTPEAAEAAFQAHPGSRLLVVTSPTYEGVVSDVAALADVAHAHGALLLVDEAHGAHLGISPVFGPSAVTLGADLVVQSLHKTLPSLTQTGLLHLCSDRVDEAEVGHWLSVFETSSPSYLLMASIDGCVRLLSENGPAVFGRWAEGLVAFRNEMGQPERLSLPLMGHPLADQSKLVVSARGTALTGPALMERLRREEQIELEMAAADYVVAMTGAGDTPEGLARFARALRKIDGTIADGTTETAPPLPLPAQCCPMHEAVERPFRLAALEESAGAIAADFLWAYPPGIPLIAPGERIPPELAAYAQTCRRAGVALHTARQTPEGQLRVME